MFLMLLTIIYVAFISLGLPDSVLGAAWPVMHSEFQVSLTSASTISTIICCLTIVSSLNADRLINRFGTGKLTAFSVMLTAIALFGFSISTEFYQLCLWAIPYGLGAGAVDSGLNNYVALHYSSRHMSWLHCFWGIGASIGPYVMGYTLTNLNSWRMGYRIIAIFQVILTAIIFISLPIWRGPVVSNEQEAVHIPLNKALKLPGAISICVAFLFYCALETTSGLWASSYLVTCKNIQPETAAFFASLFYTGITIGRFLSGFISEKLGDTRMIRLGEGILVIGIVLVIVSPSEIPALSGLVLIGIGCAPIYPSVIHSTPARFGRANSQSLVGIQMASAYVGSAASPKVFQLVSDKISIGIYPWALALLAVILIAMTEVSNRAMVNRNNF